MLLNTLDHVRNPLFEQQYQQYQMLYAKQRKIDALFNDNIVDYRKKNAPSKAKETMKKQVVTLEK